MPPFCIEKRPKVIIVSHVNITSSCRWALLLWNIMYRSGRQLIQPEVVLIRAHVQWHVKLCVTLQRCDKVTGVFSVCATSMLLFQSHGENHRPVYLNQ